jgi:short-subunit dehydrogenase
MSMPQPDPTSVALVTGASAGLGQQFARQLVERGHRVALVARRAERLEALAAELGGPDHALTIAADLAVEADRDRLAEELARQGLQVSILVNNAGFGIYGAFVENDRQQEVRQVRVDVEAVVDLTARYLPEMVRRGSGAVINVASSSGFLPSPYNAGYAAAKAHVLHFSEALRTEVKQAGVTVTAVCPGPVATEFQQANDVDYFTERMPGFTLISAERAVRDALRAAERGKRTLVPGNPAVKAWFAPVRWAPNPLRIAITGRLMKR